MLNVIFQHTADPDPEVRDTACTALGSIMKCIGESAFTVIGGPELTSDKTKMAKVYTRNYIYIQKNKKKIGNLILSIK